MLPWQRGRLRDARAPTVSRCRGEQVRTELMN